MMTSSNERSNPSLTWLSENELGVANGLLQLGFSLEQIAHYMAVPEAKIYIQFNEIRDFEKQQLAKNMQLDGMSGDKVAQAHWLYEQGLSFGQIAKAIYVSKHAVMANKKAIKNYKEGGAE